jgi:ubiquinone/menaquinone biosynthesis C-methylase UbiE/uncharacterized protein YbaR (Trm112 family)
MRKDILNVLACPHCRSGLELEVHETDSREVRTGQLQCNEQRHRYAVENGIVHFAAGFDHEAVQREIAYENSTYRGDQRLMDASTVARFPETLSELWPHVRYFGPDFRGLLDHLNIIPGSWVLDVGTAACWTSRLLAERGANVIALDVNTAEWYGLRTADILFDAHPVYFERVLESMTHLPFRDSSIDYVTFNASLHHTPDLPKTLRECRRVLKPGGAVAMVNEELVSFRHRYLCGRRTHTDVGSHHEIPFSELEQAAGEAGFTVDYRLTRHVKDYLKIRVGRRIASAIEKHLECLPALMKQMKSVLVILTPKLNFTV